MAKDDAKAGKESGKQLEKNLKTVETQLKIDERRHSKLSSQLDTLSNIEGSEREREAIARDILALDEKIEDSLNKQDELTDKIEKKEGKRSDNQDKIMAGIGAMNSLIDTAVGLLEQQSNITRTTADTMGMSVTSAMELNTEIAKAVKNGKMNDTTIASTLETYKELEGLYGSTGLISAEMAADIDILGKQLGIGNKETAAMFAHMQLIDGASKEAAESSLLFANNLADAYGVNFGSVMKDVAASGKDFQKYFGGSTKDMMKAAVQMRKMGFELKDMVDMSSNLLDIEGSIEKQMKFNMLTGKNINMDKARALMLSGDQAAAMEEIKNQVGDTSELNMVERQALDELLGGKLQEMEMAQNKQALEEEAGTIDAEKQDLALEAMDTENVKLLEKNALLEQGSTSYEQSANWAKNKLETELALAAPMTENLGIARTLVAVQTALAVVSTMAAVAQMFASFGQIPFGVGIALAAVAAVGLFAMLMTAQQAAKPVADAVIDPQGGLVVEGEKGKFQLDKDDSIIAGTEIGKGTVPVGGGGGGNVSIDLNPLLVKIDQLINAVRQQKKTTVSVDGYKLDEAIHLEKIPPGLS